MKTFSKVAVVAACACLTAWIIKKCIDQRTDIHPLSPVDLDRHMGSHECSHPEPSASAPAESPVAEGENSEQRADTPTEPEAT